MLGNGKQRAVEILHGVAAFTAILVRSIGELPPMDVLVAVHAVCKLHVVNSGLACRKVALRAFYFEVLAFERVARACVLLHSEKRRFPALNRVALRAFSHFLAARELALVDVFVAVSAIRKGELFLEITV